MTEKGGKLGFQVENVHREVYSVAKLAYSEAK